jgi:hypothetical protein
MQQEGRHVRHKHTTSRAPGHPGFRAKFGVNPRIHGIAKLPLLVRGGLA